MVKTQGIKLSRKEKQRMKEDALRPLRVIERLDFSRIYDDAPVEVIEGYTVTDTETNEVFGVFKMQNTAKEELRSLAVRLLLYEGTSNIATRKIDFVYSAAAKSLGKRTMPVEEEQSLPVRLGIKAQVLPQNIRQGETFGDGVLIPLPKGYCRKMEFEIRTVEYADGRKEDIKIVSGRKYTAFSELNDELRYAYSKMNVYRRQEAAHPIKNIPQQSERVWLCCCGHKNLIAAKKCAKCDRDKDWQLANLTESSLNSQLEKLKDTHDPGYVHTKKVAASPRLDVISAEERRRRAQAAEAAKKRVERQEENKRDGRTVVILLVLLMVFLFIIIEIALYIRGDVKVKQDAPNGGDDGGAQAEEQAYIDYGKDTYCI